MPKPTETESRPQIPWVQGELRLAGMFDARMIQLFRAIESTGSINRAAKEVGLSYKGAWQMVERANNLAPQLLVSTATGGAKGGGTKLTPAGYAFLQVFAVLEAKHRTFLEEINRSLEQNPDMLFLLRRLLVKASARNQFFGKITEIRRGDIGAEVCVTLKGGESIVASLAVDALLSREFTSGGDVLVLIKSSDIVVVADFGDYRLLARNQLHGIVSRLQKGAVTAEIIIELPGGDAVTATITRDSAETLQLSPGMPAAAVFKSNAAILGVIPN
ncbi:MAG: TOBE domain-containing protein [Gammaproteobacteria bacterium]